MTEEKLHRDSNCFLMLIIRSMSPIMRLSYPTQSTHRSTLLLRNNFCFDFELWFFIFSHGTADNFLLDIEGNKTWNIESLVTEVDPKTIHFIQFWMLNLIKGRLKLNQTQIFFWQKKTESLSLFTHKFVWHVMVNDDERTLF